jgi:hypothetical protein
LGFFAASSVFWRSPREKLEGNIRFAFML